MKKMGLLFDERLSHDRKKVFHRNMSVFKLKYSVEFLPSTLHEESAFIDAVEKEKFDIVMIPWHLYFTWKRAANLSAVRMIGYFADPLLHFEFQAIPNYQNFILLDFYRFNLDEIEILLKLMISKSHETELVEVFGKTAHYFTQEWYPADQENSQCVDFIFDNPILKTPALYERIPSLRLFVTSLWLACFREKVNSNPDEATARFVLGEYNKRIMVQLTYTSTTLTAKETLKELWPTGEHDNILFREMTLHSDFLKVYHFPKTRKISVTGLFLPESPSSHHTGEVRGFWIENRL